MHDRRRRHQPPAIALYQRFPQLRINGRKPVDPAKKQPILAPKLRKNLDELRQQGVSIGKSHHFGHPAHAPSSGKLIEQGFKHAALSTKEVVYRLPGHPGSAGQKIERETLKPTRFKMRTSGPRILVRLS